MALGHKRLRGAANFRQRILLATLAGTPITIHDIRARDQFPGVRNYEGSLLLLMEKISNGCSVVINETGTKIQYKPGILTGGRNLVHDCGTERSIGITNDEKDPCVDTFRTTTLPILKHFGVPIEDLELKVVSRGAPPLGGGEVMLKVPVVLNSLKAVKWIDEGMVKRVRGVAYSTRVSPHISNRMFAAARGVLNRLLPDVHIFTDHYSGAESGKSPGYGISLVAETTTGCLLGVDGAANCSKENEFEENRMQMLPEDLGSQAAMLLLEEIKEGGVVDTTHQSLLFLMCALCPEDVCQVRIGKLSPYGIQTLRNIKEFLDVKFNIQPDSKTGTVILTCVGSGYRNLSRKVT